ncbi:hypothetical protein KIW84_055283 [Lathyrus oleraceus]|uniref:Uncharacterized protein n=1 Tax=Pisum sativum TaxID=3888 RepID=A0A9D4WVB2_PEA|nr:hypothetical protein KIW84_055283 [Pisum sativum]
MTSNCKRSNFVELCGSSKKKRLSLEIIGERYNALDALRLISFEDEKFHCEHCNGKLEVESDKLDIQEGEMDM